MEASCPPCEDGTELSCPDAGGLPPDFCNSKEEAEADSTNCHLTVTTGGAAPQCKQEVYISRLADGGVDQDWYFAQMPGNLTPRSLLHVNGGYLVPQTAVNFSLNVLKDPGGGGALTTVANGIDAHGAAAPKPVNLIVPFSESNARLFVVVGDQGANGPPKVDNRNTYSVCMEIIDNPDQNEPNDMTPTTIPLTGNMGTSGGFLATNDDVDNFQFTVGGSGRQILYLHITEMGMHPTNPPPPFRLSYTLYDPANVPVSEGVMDNDFLPVDMATARLVGMTGNYRLEIKGFKPSGSTLPVKGDLRLNYLVEVRILPDLDMLEPNDTQATARPVTLSIGGSQTLTGKIATVPDEEWFHIQLPARASPSTLRYRVNVATTGGRYPPLTGTPSRQLRLMQVVTTGATPADQLNNCKTNQMVCPRAEDAPIALVDSVCNSAMPPLCVWSERNEERPRLADLRNMTGAVPVPANQATDWYLFFRDEGVGASKYADDRDWTLTLDWRDEPDEALASPRQVTLNGSTTVSSGELSYGYGYPHRQCPGGCVLVDPDWFDRPEALRGVEDYDAVTSDRDLFEFSFGGATGDQSWEVSWDLEHPDGGSEPPAELAFDMWFCGTGQSSYLCAMSEERIMGFSDQQLTPWYLPQSQANATTLFTKQNMGTFTRYTVEPIGCPCHSAARVATGHFFVDMVALYRTSNAPLRYRVNQRITAYPGAGFTRDGGAGTCPTATPDGGAMGCGFAD
jgi:hypothetical protein